MIKGTNGKSPFSNLDGSKRKPIKRASTVQAKRQTSITDFLGGGLKKSNSSLSQFSALAKEPSHTPVVDLTDTKLEDSLSKKDAFFVEEEPDLGPNQEDGGDKSSNKPFRLLKEPSPYFKQALQSFDVAKEPSPYHQEALKSFKSTTTSTVNPTTVKSPTTINTPTTLDLHKKKRLAPWSDENSVSSKIQHLASRNPRVSSQTTPKSKPPSAVSFSDEQNKVMRYIVQDRLNVFYTGSAGTGKSVLLRELVSQLQRKFGASAIAVTASTGLAAVNIGGQTINRFAGIGLGRGTVDEMFSKAKKSRVTEKWRRTKVLILDEVSMIDATLFSKLNHLAKKIMKSNKPFGGIQVVLTGDFFQLPPVAEKGQASSFCFQAECWKEVVHKTVLLHKVFRQQGDTELIDMLNCLRLGSLNEEMTQKFARLTRPLHYDDGIQPTELFPTRFEVQRANIQRLKSLPGNARVYKAMDYGPPHLKKMLENVMAPGELELKEDAQVMMLKNTDEQLVNGTVGRVMFFLTESVWEKLQTCMREDLFDREQYLKDIRLISRIFSAGQLDPQTLGLLEELKRKRGIASVLDAARLDAHSVPYPVIKFSTNTGPRYHLVNRHDFILEDKSSSEALKRSQLPLLLSWALSIHKSQGQTLDRVKVDLAKVFEIGQVYVALSRAVSKEGLQIVNFQPWKIKTSEIVKQFYAKLE